MNWKELMKDYLSFTRRDRIAIIVLLLVILSVYFLPQIISPGTPGINRQVDTAWIATLKRLEQKNTADGYPKRNVPSRKVFPSSVSNGPYPGRTPAMNTLLFNFNPNSLPAEGWKKLGLRDRTIRTILNFTSKGGRFREAADLKKIYGLFPDEYERLAPYIRIPVEEVAKRSGKEEIPDKKSPGSYTKKYAPIDINLADTTAFISLPGIGSKLAARIVNFREKLGGFYTVDQVGETFGLPDSTFRKIKPYLEAGTTEVRKLNINTASEDELKAHPYIRYALAKPIVAFRKENGYYGRLEDIKKVMAVTEATYKKIAPYLTL